MNLYTVGLTIRQPCSCYTFQSRSRLLTSLTQGAFGVFSCVVRKVDQSYCHFLLITHLLAWQVVTLLLWNIFCCPERELGKNLIKSGRQKSWIWSPGLVVRQLLSGHQKKTDPDMFTIKQTLRNTSSSPFPSLVYVNLQEGMRYC